MYCKPRNITQRKVDHVHALLRARVITAEELIRSPDPGNAAFPLPWTTGQVCQFRK